LGILLANHLATVEARKPERANRENPAARTFFGQIDLLPYFSWVLVDIDWQALADLGAWREMKYPYTKLRSIACSKNTLRLG